MDRDNDISKDANYPLNKADKFDADEFDEDEFDEDYLRFEHSIHEQRKRKMESKNMRLIEEGKWDKWVSTDDKSDICDQDGNILLPGEYDFLLGNPVPSYYHPWTHPVIIAAQEHLTIVDHSWRTCNACIAYRKIEAIDISQSKVLIDGKWGYLIKDEGFSESLPENLDWVITFFSTFIPKLRIYLLPAFLSSMLVSDDVDIAIHPGVEDAFGHLIQDPASTEIDIVPSVGSRIKVVKQQVAQGSEKGWFSNHGPQILIEWECFGEDAITLDTQFSMLHCCHLILRLSPTDIVTPDGAFHSHSQPILFCSITFPASDPILPQLFLSALIMHRHQYFRG